MKKQLLLLNILLLLAYCSFSQSIGIGTTTPDSSAALDISHSSKGLLIPRMTTASIAAITNPARGLMVYDTLLSQLLVNMGTPDEPVWQSIAAKSSWSLGGNWNTNPVTQFVGTNDTRPLRFRVNGILAGDINVNGNIFFGLRSGENNSFGYSNIAIGADALKSNYTRSNLVAIGDSALFKNGTGAVASDDAIGNTAIGSKSLFANTVGNRNTATGSESLYSNTTGSINTAYGVRSLYSNTAGRFNSATGYASLYSNTTGESNTATGNQSLYYNNTGHDNTATGSESLYSNTTGAGNTAMGSQSLRFNSTGGDNTAVGGGALRLNTNGVNNTAVGALSLNLNTTGVTNTAVGVQSLYSNTIGNYNTANGAATLYANTSGSGNTANGYQCMANNTTGFGNMASGYYSLYSNTLGWQNTASGYASLYSNTTGNYNVAMGHESLFYNSTGITNTGLGYGALYFNMTGNANTSVGNGALRGNTSGSFNTAVGVFTLTATNASQFNTAIGYYAAKDFNLGYNNTIIGAHAGVNADGIFNSVAIGESALSTASNQVRLGNTSSTSIGGQVSWTSFSDGRYKKNIQEEVKGIDFIMKLRPVTYQLDIAGINKKLKMDKGNDEATNKVITENEKTLFTGFIAQEVEQAAKEVGYNFSGVDKPKNDNDLYGLRYAEFVVPLVKAMQEQQAMINELKKQNVELQKRVSELEKK